MPIPLIERSGEEIEHAVKKAIEALPEVRSCPHVIVRAIGRLFDIRAHVLLDSNLKFSEVHRIVSTIKQTVQKLVPHSRVFVRTEPKNGSGHMSLHMLVKSIADAVPKTRGAHNVHIQRVDGHLGVDLHLEVAASLPLKQAHEAAAEVESRLRAAVPELDIVNVHIESASERIASELAQVDPEIKWFVEHVINHSEGVKKINNVKVFRMHGHLHVTFSCYFSPDITVKQAHDITRTVEEKIRKAYPNVVRIDVVEAPA